MQGNHYFCFKIRAERFLCFCNEDMYYRAAIFFFNGDLCDEVKCDFINDLSKHEVIACNSKALEIVFYLQQSYFSKSEFFAERIRMSFRSLLLTNIPVSQAYMEKIRFWDIVLALVNISLQKYLRI